VTATLRAVGAGLPRTGTASLKIALEQVLGGRCYHMNEIPGHPFDLGAHWRTGLTGGSPPWDEVFVGYVASLDWPASMFWHQLSTIYADAPVLLSRRESAEAWLQSFEATILPVARRSVATGADTGNDLITLLERFTGRSQWDDPDVLMSAYERHNTEVRRAVGPDRLVEWRPGDGWGPICRQLGLSTPDEPFPWVNRREDWG
jgi:hypothetical protein